MTEMSDDASRLGRILKAMLDGPSGAHTFETGRDEMSSCPACGTPWDGCDASQPYADEEDAPCCDACVHEWVPPPAAYTITPAYEAYMNEIGLGAKSSPRRRGKSWPPNRSSETGSDQAKLR